MESDDVFERTLPTLYFEDVDSPVLRGLPTLVEGEGEELRQVATPSPSPHVVSP